MSPPHVSFLYLFPPDISCLLLLSSKIRPYLSLEMILRFSLELVAPASCTSNPEKKRAYCQSNINKSRSLCFRDLSLYFFLDVIYLQRNFRSDIFDILFNLQLLTVTEKIFLRFDVHLCYKSYLWGAETKSIVVVTATVRHSNMINADFQFLFIRLWKTTRER